jgi:hypothetical protein
VETREKLDLLERDAELGALENLVGSGDVGGVLMAIEGPPGIGKTALMAETKSRGNEAGMRVVSARGSELERAFSFGVVRQLFEPLLASLSEEERADALAGAAALAEPLFNPERLDAETGADSSLATLHGLYWLSANLAARRPLLLTIDDLHWSDLPSLRWLAYLLPRIEGLALSVLVGLRPAEAGEDPGLLNQIVADPLATVIRPAPLSLEATMGFVREALTPSADDAFCAVCHEETGGNPLLLRELVHAIAIEGVVPTEANVPRLRELEARAGSRAVSLRLAWLPPEATALAKAVAVLGDDADTRQAAARADLDDNEAPGARAALARADVVLPPPPQGPPRSVSPRSCFEVRRRAGRSAGGRCARRRALRAHAGHPRARLPICAEPSTNLRRPPSAPKCWSSSARPRRGSAARRRSSICKPRAS